MPPMQFDWMPMMRDFVPRQVRPWIFVIFAFCFQMSGGMYMGALNEIVSSRQLLREDITMCLYCNLAGMAVYFPLLFRMKFRHTNKFLLFCAAFGLAFCSLAAAYAPNLPVLWAVCVISGFCKIQGTFECMSTIQLWMTPKRDFRVFFPLLHIFILGAMQVSDYVAARMAYTWGWEMMHWLMFGIFCAISLTIVLIMRRIHLMPIMPLLGIDWVGCLLWLATLLQTAYFFCYGETLDWLHSFTMRAVGIGALVTFALAIVRSFIARHPFISPQIWKVPRIVPIMVIVALGEFFLASERVLEEVFYEEGMDYSNMTTAANDLWTFTGVIIGCLLSLLWMKVLSLNAFRLTTVGFLLLGAYLILFYTTASTEFDFRSLRLLVTLRTVAYAFISISLMVILNDIMTFQTFFMALSVFNMFHMIIGGVIGSAVYSHGLDYYMADNLSRYAEYFDHVSLSQDTLHFGEKMELFTRGLMLVSIKQIYGWIAYGCIFTGLAMLTYKVPLLRKGYKRMQGWVEVGKRLGRKLRSEAKADGVEALGA